jgi:signal transduction histidine kinase
MFTIANQCENLPEETLERIWDSFYRADSSRTVKGTGLGLPIARAVIHLHRGTCEARNTSTDVEFRFMLPQ